MPARRDGPPGAQRDLEKSRAPSLPSPVLSVLSVQRPVAGALAHGTQENQLRCLSEESQPFKGAGGQRASSFKQTNKHKSNFLMLELEYPSGILCPQTQKTASPAHPTVPLPPRPSFPFLPVLGDHELAAWRAYETDRQTLWAFLVF